MKIELGARATWILIGLISLISWAAFSLSTPNHDVAWLWLATQRFIDGAVYGRDIVELNPPLIVLLTAPAVLAQRLVHADFYWAYCGWMALLGAGSAFLVDRAARTTPGLEPEAGVFAAAFTVLLVVIFGAQYGQRDPLAATLALPFLVGELRHPRGSPRLPARLAWAVGAAAGIGILLKPQFVIVPAAALAYRAWRLRAAKGLLSPQYAVMIGLGLGYAVLVATAFPDWLALTKTTLIAYSAYDSPPLSLAQSFRVDGLCWAGLAMLLATSRAKAEWRVWTYAVHMAAASALFYLAGLMQMKDFTYHFMPGRLLLAVSLMLLIVSARATDLVFRAWGLGACLLAALLAYEGLGKAKWLQRQATRRGEFVDLVRSAHGAPMLALTSQLIPTFPSMLEEGGRWASSSPCQWLVPAAVKLAGGGPADRRKAELLRRQATALVVRDLTQFRPAVVAVSRDSYPLARDFDWVGFYSREGSFRRAWAGYCPVAESPQWTVYRPCAPSSGASGQTRPGWADASAR